MNFPLRWTTIPPTSINFGGRIWENMTSPTMLPSLRPTLTMNIQCSNSLKTRFTRLLALINMIGFWPILPTESKERRRLTSRLRFTWWLWRITRRKSWLPRLGESHLASLNTRTLSKLKSSSRNWTENSGNWPSSTPGKNYLTQSLHGSSEPQQKRAKNARKSQQAMGQRLHRLLQRSHWGGTKVQGLLRDRPAKLPRRRATLRGNPTS